MPLVSNVNLKIKRRPGATNTGASCEAITLSTIHFPSQHSVVAFLSCPFVLPTTYKIPFLKSCLGLDFLFAGFLKQHQLSRIIISGAVMISNFWIV